MKKILFLLILTAAIGFASDSDSKMKSANTFYQQKKYTEAIAAYKSIIGTNNVSASVYYNIGNCYFKMGQYGYAVLYFEKALKLNPGDDDIRHNVQLAKSRTADKIESVPQLFLYRWVESVISLYSADGWMKFAIYMSFIFGALIIGFLFVKSFTVKRYLLLSAVPFLLLLALAITMTFTRYNAEKQREYAIVTIPITGVKNAPEENSKDAFIIHEGLKVKVEDSVDQWYRIRLEDGKIGWVLKVQVELI
jgi:tetratricopeptide (TPR) repeat protein